MSGRRSSRQMLSSSVFVAHSTLRPEASPGEQVAKDWRQKDGARRLADPNNSPKISQVFHLQVSPLFEVPECTVRCPESPCVATAASHCSNGCDKPPLGIPRRAASSSRERHWTSAQLGGRAWQEGMQRGSTASGTLPCLAEASTRVSTID